MAQHKHGVGIGAEAGSKDTFRLSAQCGSMCHFLPPLVALKPKAPRGHVTACCLVAGAWTVLIRYCTRGLVSLLLPSEPCSSCLSAAGRRWPTGTVPGDTNCCCTLLGPSQHDRGHAYRCRCFQQTGQKRTIEGGSTGIGLVLASGDLRHEQPSNA